MDSNVKMDGRAANRRVEFVIVEVSSTDGVRSTRDRVLEVEPR